MTTAQAWIDETRDMLLSGYVEELLQLGDSTDSASTSLNVTYAQIAYFEYFLFILDN